jgi:hypothetical protein
MNSMSYLRCPRRSATLSAVYAVFADVSTYTSGLEEDPVPCGQ